MNHESYSPNHEKNKEQPDDIYSQWSKLIEDVPFQGENSFSPTQPESNQAPTKPEGVHSDNEKKVHDTESSKKWDLTKISGPLGSNDGGWYENPTGERFYVKFYENPSQGQAEFVANAIYEKLGIKAAHSEIIQLDGREAIASSAVLSAMPASMEAQRSSKDVREGFVADAFLANWDVVGLAYDNIIQGEDGFYRIDNGGSLIFRAQGGDKLYSPNAIPELQSMLVPGRSAGDVFAGITEEEIRRQARELVGKLSPEDIKAIVDESGLKGEDRGRILDGLLGRREYLVKAFGAPESIAHELSTPESERPRRSVSETIRMLDAQEIEYAGELAMYPRAEIICDRDHIEDQRIDIINKKDRGVIEFRFKLRTPTETIKAMVAKLGDKRLDTRAETTTPSGAILKRGEITYDGFSTGGSCELCEAFVFEKDGTKVFIADPVKLNYSAWLESYHDGGAPENEPSEEYLESKFVEVRTAIGLVKVDAPANMDPGKIEQVLEEILEKDLGIQNALSEVPEEAEREYKRARYEWQHVVDGTLTSEEKERADKMNREEVFPGYTTFVEKGKYREYLRTYGEDIRAVHNLFMYTDDPKTLYSILTKGLVCTTERYSRGLTVSGMSSEEDMRTGGADSVFTRITRSTQRRDGSGTTVVLKPEIFDRTDWYSYGCDRFGSTSQDVFDSRISPDQAFAMAPGMPTNESMFRTGISANYIESIEVDDHYRNDYIAKLRSMGLEEIDGRPIEDIIVSRQKVYSKPQNQASSPNTSDALKAATDVEKAEAQAKIQAFINGETPYTSVEDLFSLAYKGDDPFSSAKSMIESIIAHGEKEKLVNDLVDYLKDISINDLRVLASGAVPEDFPDEDKQLATFFQNTLGIDYSRIYEAALASRSETAHDGAASGLETGRGPGPNLWTDGPGAP